MQHEQTFDISFGDCDPAGIVFYPNAFRWMDGTFHALLRRFGGHAALCQSLGAVGLGLVDASAKFLSPMRDGDRLILRASLSEWSRRSFTVDYEGHCGGTRAFTGREVRCLFKPGERGITAGDLAPLRQRLEEHDGR